MKKPFWQVATEVAESLIGKGYRESGIADGKDDAAPFPIPHGQDPKPQRSWFWKQRHPESKE